MRNLLLFIMISLDGYFEGPNHDISWHNVDAEFNDFAAEQLDSVDVLLFGRVTYELMASFWPTPYALETDPVIAYKMNAKTKLVCSTTLPIASWANTQIISQDVGGEIARLKQQLRKSRTFGNGNVLLTYTPAVTQP